MLKHIRWIWILLNNTPEFPTVIGWIPISCGRNDKNGEAQIAHFFCLSWNKQGRKKKCYFRQELEGIGLTLMNSFIVIKLHGILWVFIHSTAMVYIKIERKKKKSYNIERKEKKERKKKPLLCSLRCLFETHRGCKAHTNAWLLVNKQWNEMMALFKEKGLRKGRVEKWGKCWCLTTLLCQKTSTNNNKNNMLHKKCDFDHLSWLDKIHSQVYI